jgi:hypothetical protein
MLIIQALLYNTIFFSYALVLARVCHIAWFFGVNAERRSLEYVAAPLSEMAKELGGKRSTRLGQAGFRSALERCPSPGPQKPVWMWPWLPGATVSCRRGSCHSGGRGQSRARSRSPNGSAAQQSLSTPATEETLKNPAQLVQSSGNSSHVFV